jgi:hypothetical protein
VRFPIVTILLADVSSVAIVVPVQHEYPPAKWSKLHRSRFFKKSTIQTVEDAVRSGAVMNMNQRQIALSLLEALREDLIYAHLNNGSRILDVVDLRQYIYEQMGRIRTNAFVMDGLYGSDHGHAENISKNNNGHKGEAHPEEKSWRERPAGGF